MVAPSLSDMQEMKQKNSDKIEEILEEWRKTKNYPRKKKKAVRKELQLNYSIFKWADETFLNQFDFSKPY